MITTRGTLQARLFWAFALVTIIAVALPAILSRNALYRDRLDLASSQALTQVSVIKAMLESGVDQPQIEALLASVKEAGARMTIATEDGRVIHDSHVGGAALLEMDNHNDRPEIESARLKGKGVSFSHSKKLDIDAKYAAA